MTIAPLDIAAFGELILKAGAWIRSATKKSSNRKEQFCAHVLHEAGVVVASIRVLEDETRRLGSLVDRVDSSWRQTERKALLSEIDDFVQEKVIVSRLRVSLHTLSTYEQNTDLLGKKFGHKMKVAISWFLPPGFAVLNKFDGRPADPDLFIAEEYAEFWQALKSAETDEVLTRAKELGKRAFESKLPPLASIVEQQYGSLKSKILIKYPSILEPIWLELPPHAK